eukprot:15476649-Alexandrium_andersonii.AAC.1
MSQGCANSNRKCTPSNYDSKQAREVRTAQAPCKRGHHTMQWEVQQHTQVKNTAQEYAYATSRFE